MVHSMILATPVNIWPLVLLMPMSPWNGLYKDRNGPCDELNDDEDEDDGDGYVEDGEDDDEE